MVTLLRPLVLCMLVTSWTIVVVVSAEEQKTQGDTPKTASTSSNTVVQQTQDLTTLSKLLVDYENRLVCRLRGAIAIHCAVLVCLLSHRWGYG